MLEWPLVRRGQNGFTPHDFRGESFLSSHLELETRELNAVFLEKEKPNEIAGVPSVLKALP